MIGKSPILKFNTDVSGQRIVSRFLNLKIDKNANNKDSSFKYSEMDFDNILDETDNISEKCMHLSVGLSQEKVFKNLRLNTFKESYVTKVMSQSKSLNVKEVIHNRQILFPSRQKNKPSNSSLFLKYIPISTIDHFKQWNRFAKKRPFVNIERFIQQNRNEPKIKKLKPNNFKKGFDIVPNYLNKKTKKCDKQIMNEDSVYDSKNVLKAYKGCRSVIKNIVNVCFVGPQKSGKSTLMGSILLTKGVFDAAFIKKTRWEATKASATECQVSWLLDTSSNERLARETIVASSYVMQFRENVLRLTDCPGNEAYFHETLRSYAMADIVVLVIDHRSYSTNSDYLNRFFKLVKVFSQNHVIVVLTNTDGDSCERAREDLTAIARQYVKMQPRIITVNDLGTVRPLELASIVASIDECHVTNEIEACLQAPLVVEVIDVRKSVESALPIVVGRVLAGGLSAGVNNPLSAIVVVPGAIHGTVKSMTFEDDTSETRSRRSIAFAGDLVELTLQEIVHEDSIRRGALLCHRRFPLPSGNVVRSRLLMLLRSTADEDAVPLAVGTSVHLWTRTRSIMAVVAAIVSVDGPTGAARSHRRSPRFIGPNDRGATVLLRADEAIVVRGPIDGDKFDVFLLFHNSVLLAAGRFLSAEQ